MEIAQEKIDLISKIIKNDRKYAGNEDLYDDFLNEACSRSAMIINSLDNEITLEAYLKRIVTSSIINVLKDSGRLRRSKAGYMSTNETIIEPKVQENIIDYSSYNISYLSVNIPESPEENAIQADLLKFVAESVKKIDANNTDKKYLDIFSLRYGKGMTQKEISDELQISQSEISKRIYELINKVKEILE